MTQTEEKALVRKMAWKVLPFLLVAYLICIIDRLNVGLAALTMNAELGFTATVYGWGAGLFFIGYFIGEVPSNLILSKVGARIWFARIMITWGIFAIAMGFISGDVSFFLIRFLLGVAEAGFFPGVIYYLTLWFPAEYRGRIFGLFLIISPLNNTIAAPLGGLILKYFDGAMGFPGWRWLFIVGGHSDPVPGLPVPARGDRPARQCDVAHRCRESAPAEKLGREAASRTETKHLSIWQTLGNAKGTVVRGGLYLAGHRHLRPEPVDAADHQGHECAESVSHRPDHGRALSHRDHLYGSVVAAFRQDGRARFPLRRCAGNRRNRHDHQRVHRLSGPCDGCHHLRGNRHVLLATRVLVHADRIPERRGGGRRDCFH
jgi:hypothetical protein